MSDEAPALARLREFLAAEPRAIHSRLPPERSLCEALGVTRSALRRALATLESEGQVWRHVGRGTFVGSRPADSGGNVAALAERARPGEVVEARLLLEPQLAGLAAVNASAADLREMRQCLRKSGAAQDWRTYEAWDNRLHRAVATATHNSLLISVFDTLNSIRRAVVWHRARTTPRPPADHHSFAEHEALVTAIEARDPQVAAARMHDHLESVGRRLLRPARGATPQAPDAVATT